MICPATSVGCQADCADYCRIRAGEAREDPVAAARRLLGERRMRENELAATRDRLARAIAAAHAAGWTYAALGRRLGLSRSRVEAMEKRR